MASSASIQAAKRASRSASSVLAGAAPVEPADGVPEDPCADARGAVGQAAVDLIRRQPGQRVLRQGGDGLDGGARVRADS